MCVMEPLNTAGNWDQEPVSNTHLRDIPEEQGSWGALTLIAWHIPHRGLPQGAKENLEVKDLQAKKCWC